MRSNVATVTGAENYPGDVWTWTAIDADTKLIISYEFSDKRGADLAFLFMGVSSLFDSPWCLPLSEHRG